MITITKQAQAYLETLKQKPENDGKDLFIRAVDPETPYAEASLDFVKIGPEHTEDFMLTFGDLNLFIDQKSVAYLSDTIIDLQENNLTKEISIDTPHLKPLSLYNEGDNLFERISWVIETEIKPQLAMHGGSMELIDVKDNTAIVKFGGGCQGCSMIDATLKQGIEENLKTKFPEIKAIEDVTEHDLGQTPYFS